MCKENMNLISNKDVIFEILKHDSCNYQYLSDAMKKDKEIALFAAKIYLKYEYLPDIFKEDVDVLKELLNKNIKVFQEFSEQAKDNFELVKFAIQKNGEMFCFASKRLKKDKELALLSLRNNNKSFKRMTKVLRNDKEIATIVLQKTPEYYKRIGENLKKDKDLAKIVISKNSYYFCELDQSLMEDQDFVDELLTNNIKIIIYFPIKFFTNELAEKLSKHKDVNKVKNLLQGKKAYEDFLELFGRYVRENMLIKKIEQDETVSNAHIKKKI